MMNNIPSDKYNIAWFKIADCVARGEKERALGMYRLLAHSFDDIAFSNQLEGDIFHSFGDNESARNRYDQAIDLYKNENRLLEAAAVCEHMHCMYPTDQTYLLLLTGLYNQLGATVQVGVYVDKLVTVCVAHGDIKQAERLLEQYATALSVDMMVAIHQRFVYAIMRRTDVQRDMVLHHIYKMIDNLVCVDNTMALQNFIDLLQGLDEFYYQDACEYIKISGY
ncbi:MAG TPA: hypothetical protein VGT41_03015 [Candidatus Babeliales bacterium]|nr:hypothetical protein [Candidatus Babeliales bacterium]